MAGPDRPTLPGRARWAGLTPQTPDLPLPKTTPRRLFLDDDPLRAGAFLEAYPDAIWVQTVPECVEKLAEAWDEVHLDHDLGGEIFVDIDREDCGMEVVRWLARETRPHLGRARFVVHSHNMVAAWMMVMEIRALGYRVEARPFGLDPPEVEPEPEPEPATGLRRRWERARSWVRRLRGRQPLPGPAPAQADPTDEVP
jgi:hypothetical protein